mmetsp:Transcript_19789/g.75869  ORF Transcript_19789/g.75869 Transcript_19789/m.75869 type:complete len:336 (-) Transcript_19789:43-1050(-)
MTDTLRYVPVEEGFSHFLSRFHAGDIAGEKNKIVEVASDDTLVHALEVLSSAKLLSAPVKDTKTGEYKGFVDMVDIMSVLLMSDLAAEIVEQLAMKEVDWVEFMKSSQELINSTHVRDIVEVSGRNPWKPVKATDDLKKLISSLTQESHTQRVPIIGEEGEVVNIVTRTKLVLFLFNELPQFPSISDTKICETEWFKKRTQPVVTIPATVKAALAGETMVEKTVSGLAVVDEDGKLVGAISATDFKRCLGQNMFAAMQTPVAEFLRLTNDHFKREQSLSPVVCSPDETIMSMLKKLHDNHIHRLFIVDADNKPVGVISLGDIVSYLHDNWQAAEE